MLTEAKRLFDLGFAVHWIKPHSKAPVKSGWSSPTRDSWEVIKREYREGYGLGVRLGESSKLKDGTYLANIDVDVKSGEERHREEALALVRRIFPDILIHQTPIVGTGYGFRLVVKTRSPVSSGKLGSSNEECVVLMPTSEVSKRQERAVLEGRLTGDQLKSGYRVRGAWEVEFMSTGKQVVLPPSKHPETGKAYTWLTPLLDAESIPLVSVDGLGIARGRGRPEGTKVIQDFEPTDVDLGKYRLSDSIKDMIIDGTGVDNESDALLSVSLAMARAGMSDDEILSVLTDRGLFLGNTAYRHRNTEGRKAAAAWIRDYTLKKARYLTSAEAAFQDEVEISPQLDDIEAENQFKELCGEADWQSQLLRSGKNGDGPPKQTLENTVLVLTNAISPQLFEKNLFNGREQYGADAPWGRKKGDGIEDADLALIMHWCGKTYRFEPNLGIINSAISVITEENAFHPVRDFFESLPEWDGKDRLDTWLAKYHGAEGDPEYLAQVFRKWLVAAVARIYEPGAKFDWMPILEGNQGIGKSSFGAILACNRDWFRDDLPDLSDKDAALAIQGSFIVEMGELSTLRRNEVEATKGFITRQVDKVRPPYGKRWLEWPRQCVFFGTTNRDEYLRDDSGNRRFNPIKVGRLDFKALHRDRYQLWAEALFIYRNGLENQERGFMLEGVALDTAVVAQNEKIVSDESTLMAEEILDYLSRMDTIPEAERFDFSKFRIVHLFNGMNGPLKTWRETSQRNMFFATKAVKNLESKYRVCKVNRKRSHGLSIYFMTDIVKLG